MFKITGKARNAEPIKLVVLPAGETVCVNKKAKVGKVAYSGDWKESLIKI